MRLRMRRGVLPMFVLLGMAVGASGQAASDQESLAGRDLGLVGNRFPALTWDQMTPEQRTMVEHLLAGPRTSLGGPFNIMLRSPEIGDLAQEFGGKLRFLDTMPAKLRELAIIITARHWTAQFEWSAHRAAAARTGLPEATIAAIRDGRRPASLDADEEVVYDYATELLETKHISDATFAAAKQLLGESGVVELTMLMGYYQIVSMLLNVDQYPLADGAEPELQPLP